MDFVGNNAIKDGKLARQMKENKGGGMFSFILGNGTYKADKFEEDADKVVAYYRDRGYIEARVGQPELKILEDSKDSKTRLVELRIPVTEGQRYRIGKIEFEGNKIVNSEALRPLFKIAGGRSLQREDDPQGIRESEGSVRQRRLHGVHRISGSCAARSRRRDATATATAVPPVRSRGPGRGANGPPIVDVTLRLQEGKQYFVNRITFVGNTTTRDTVIRREIRLVESGVVQYRSVEVQHQAAEPARLLQAARR